MEMTINDLNDEMTNKGIDYLESIGKTINELNDIELEILTRIILEE